MRVISGSAGGQRLTTPAGNATRPTADRVKEALFSILDSAGSLPEARVLDLFAGSGALGIEALSRGASHATLVEKARPALATLQGNLRQTRLAPQSTVLAMDVFAALELLLRQEKRFDLVLLDPPYARGLHVQVLERIAPLVAIDGLVVAEASARLPLPERIGGIRRTDRRVYGDTALDFYIPEGNDAP